MYVEQNLDLIRLHHGQLEPTILCLDHGHVKLLDVMPRLTEADWKQPTADYRILKAARQSYLGSADKPTTEAEDRGLIRYLMRNRHTSPTEQVVFTFHHRLPIFVARQLVRHRTACLAGDAKLVFDLPNSIRKFKRSAFPRTIADIHRLWHVGANPILRKKKKPTFIDRIDPEATYSPAEIAALVERRPENIRTSIRFGHLKAEKQNGIIKIIGRDWLVWAATNLEWLAPMRDRVARMSLRMCDETTGEISHTQITDVWESDLLALRCDSHAQKEIRVYADAMLALIRPLVPWTLEAWEDFHPYRDAILLTALEVQALRAGADKLGDRATKREQDEWAEKRKRITPAGVMDKYPNSMQL